MLKELLNDRGISVYAAAKGSGIPYTTLNELANGKKKVADCSVKTMAALAGFLGMSIETLLEGITGAKEPVAVNPTWEAKKNHTFIFPVIASSEGYDASRIHPLKQRVVKALHEKLAEDDRIESLILFGSAINIRCNKRSDIDFAVGLKEGRDGRQERNEISELVENLTDWKADIIWADRVAKGSKLEKNISMGVRII